MINLSPKLIPVLHSQVQEDIKWLEQEDAMTAAFFNFDYVLILTSCAKVL